MWFFQIIGASWARTCSSTHQRLDTPEPHHLHHSFKGTRTIKPWQETSWTSPSFTRALASSPRISSSLAGSSTPSAGSSTSSARSWHQDPVLWVQGPCQLGTRCFKTQTHSVRDQGTTGGTWWHQWHPVGPLQVHVGINDNFINNSSSDLFSFLH